MEFREAYDPVRTLKASLKLIGRAPLGLLLSGILMQLINGAPNFGLQFGFHVLVRRGVDQTLEVAVIVVGVLISIAFALLLSTLMIAGFSQAVRMVMVDGRDPGVAALFRPNGRWGRMILATLLVVVVEAAATLPFALASGVGFGLAAALDEAAIGVVVVGILALGYLPIAIYIALGVSLVQQAVALEGLGPFDALRRSWSLVRGNRRWLLLYWVVSVVLVLAGLLLCCVGVFFTGLWVQVSQSEAYARVATRAPEGGWAIEAA
jgi:hypothetical protein